MTETVTNRRFLKVLRSIGIIFFIVIAALAFATYSVTRWAEHQILSADNWVTYASSLPKNNDVSGAIADVVTNQIFANVPIEERVGEALPPKAGFLAAPLSDQLRDRTVKLTNNLVQSDTFQSLWTGANRLAIERFLSNARASQANEPPKLSEKFNIDLSGIKPMLKERLGGEADISPALQDKSQQAISITTDLQTKREKLWKVVRTTDFIYKILPALFITSLLGLLVISANRPKAMIALSALASSILLILLILIKFTRGQVLDQVNHSQYIPAISYIYDSLVNYLRHNIFVGIGLWIIILLATILFTSPASPAVSLRRGLHLSASSDNMIIKWWHKTRGYVRHYRYLGWIGIFSTVLIYLAFFASINNVVIVNSVLLTLSGVFLVQLMADSSHQRQ